ncbi:MAG: hypothetical protein JZU47_08105 [Prolixibacteraceae bacterium]|nr:hypothetical protein [Prolixibacteraceae bacterium]
MITKKELLTELIGKKVLFSFTQYGIGISTGAVYADATILEVSEELLKTSIGNIITYYDMQFISNIQIK